MPPIHKSETMNIWVQLKSVEINNKKKNKEEIKEG